MGTSKTYRAGLIGCGGVSRSHSAGLQAARGVTLVALADVYPPNLETAARAYGVDRTYGDFREMIEREASVVTLCREFPPDTVRWVSRKLDRNEFKRRQMPPGIKLSQRAFGSGRRMPMAAKFEWENINE